jgi:hypothetical protein
VRYMILTEALFVGYLRHQFIRSALCQVHRCVVIILLCVAFLEAEIETCN